MIRLFVLSILAVAAIGVPQAAADGAAVAERLPEAGPQTVSAAPASADPPDDAVLAPNGKRAAWVSADGKSVWSARRRGSGEWGPDRRLLTIRGTAQDLVFAPDSRSIAFENPRGDHGFIAVYRLRSDRVGFLDPSFSTDTAPEWSDDGQRISFTRHMEGVPDMQLTRPVPTRLRPPDVPLTSFLGAPFVSEVEASGDGGSVAYLARESTDRSVFTVSPGERARRVMRYGGDDGQELSELAASRGGAALAYVRGGEPNDEGEIPNPNSFVTPPERQVWIVDAKGGDPELLGLGSSPRFSPGDERVIWIDGQQVMSAPLTWQDGRLRKVGQPAPLFEFAGEVSMLRFSPDGGKLAYTRSDDDGSHIEVLDMAAGTTTVLAPSAARDSRPSWSPDGSRIAFLRVEDDQPFAIWLADVGTGEAREVWKAQPGLGSAFYNLDQQDQLLWSGDDRIAFAWERDGFRHLYAVPASGGEATLLTPSEGEVETAVPSRDGSRLIYATNIGDIGRRHLSSVTFDGEVSEVTSGTDANQWAPTPLADDRLAYIDAGWNDPTRVTIRSVDGSTERAALPRVPGWFPADEMVKPQLVEFPASDGQKAYGQLFVPRPERAKGCAVIFPHGGPRRQMLPGFHYIEIYTNLYETNQYLASQGCVALSVDYRSGIMHGNAFRNAPGRGRAGASEYRDILGAVDLLRARPDVDDDKLAIYGLSWGGYITGLGLARNSDIFKVGFDMAGVHEFEGDAFPFAPTADIDKWTSPVYLAQGDDDRNVDFSQGVLLARLLQTRRPNVELVQRVFPDETHDLFLTFANLTSVYEAGTRFMLDRLE